MPRKSPAAPKVQASAEVRRIEETMAAVLRSLGATDASAERPDLFRGGITSLTVKLTVGGFSFEVAVSGPDPKAVTGGPRTAASG